MVLKKVFGYFVLLSFLCLQGCWFDFYEPPAKKVGVTSPAADDWKKDYSELLKKYVHPEKGLVDYAGLKKEEKKLEAIIAAISKVDAKAFKEDEKLAFWINAYNICMLWNVLTKYPDDFKGKKVLDYGDLFFKERKFLVAGLQVTLDELEHNILRKVKPIDGVSVKEVNPGLHVAISCAAMSCPPIVNVIWEAKTVVAKLKEQIEKISNNGFFVSYDAAKKKPKASSIVDWFFEDFKAEGKTVGGYLASFVKDATLKAALEKAGNDKKAFIFETYDWTLNDWKK